MFVFSIQEICAHRPSHSLRLSRPKDSAFSNKAIFIEMFCISFFFVLRCKCKHIFLFVKEKMLKNRLLNKKM